MACTRIPPTGRPAARSSAPIATAEGEWDAEPDCWSERCTLNAAR